MTKSTMGTKLPRKLEQKMQIVGEQIRLARLRRNLSVAQIAERADLTKAKADEALAAFQAVLVESLAKGEAVKVTGLLSVERVERAARTGRNPRTGEEIKIPAGYGVKLSAGSTLKKAVSK